MVFSPFFQDWKFLEAQDPEQAGPLGAGQDAHPGRYGQLWAISHTRDLVVLSVVSLNYTSVGIISKGFSALFLYFCSVCGSLYSKSVQ